jgi:hypothetical protein
MFDPRQQRGLEIAATARIVKKGAGWLVPSQSGNGRYKGNRPFVGDQVVCLGHDPRNNRHRPLPAVAARSHQIADLHTSDRVGIANWLRDRGLRR